MSFEAEGLSVAPHSGVLAFVNMIGLKVASEIFRVVGGRFGAWVRSALLRVRRCSIKVQSASACALWAVGCAGGVSLLAACSAGGPSGSPQTPGGNQPAAADTSERPVIAAAPARDGNIAIREEFNIAVAKGDAEALQLFMARHPEHPLTKEAKRRLVQLKRTGQDE